MTMVPLNLRASTDWSRCVAFTGQHIHLLDVPLTLHQARQASLDLSGPTRLASARETYWTGMHHSNGASTRLSSTNCILSKHSRPGSRSEEYGYPIFAIRAGPLELGLGHRAQMRLGCPTDEWISQGLILLPELQLQLQDHRGPSRYLQYQDWNVDLDEDSGHMLVASVAWSRSARGDVIERCKISIFFIM
jgi:hypothetical protein